MTGKINRNDNCWCGSGRKYKRCHKPVEDKIGAFQAAGHEVPPIGLLKTKADISGIAESGKINNAVLDSMAPHIIEGVSTGELDSLIYKKTLALGGVPAALGYKGYPKSSCISINDVVCHGIPCDTVTLQEGDIVNLDVSTIRNGYYSDASRMFCVGRVTAGKKRLVDVAKQCMEAGIRQVKPWGFLGDIGDAVNRHAQKNGYTVVREVGGHGVGLRFHEDPWVGYVGERGMGMLLVPGLVFTVEPMINMGKASIRTDEKDGWTICTADGLPSAQWETTVLVTETGCAVLAD